VNATAPHKLIHVRAGEDFTMTDDHSQQSKTSSAALTATYPWDAPYFGVPVYLRYQADNAYSDPPPATAAREHSEADISALARSLPWDSPYFGAPIYLRYPGYPVATGMVAGATEQTPSNDVPNTPDIDAEAATHITPKSSGMPPTPLSPRRHWLARLFSGR
jgi:hypothetical protein